MTMAMSNHPLHMFITQLCSVKPEGAELVLVDDNAGGHAKPPPPPSSNTRLMRRSMSTGSMDDRHASGLHCRWSTGTSILDAPKMLETVQDLEREEEFDESEESSVFMFSLGDDIDDDDDFQDSFDMEGLQWMVSRASSQKRRSSAPVPLPQVPVLSPDKCAFSTPSPTSLVRAVSDSEMLSSSSHNASSRWDSCCLKKDDAVKIPTRKGSTMLPLVAAPVTLTRKNGTGDKEKVSPPSPSSSIKELLMALEDAENADKEKSNSSSSNARRPPSRTTSSSSASGNGYEIATELFRVH